MAAAVARAVRFAPPGFALRADDLEFAVSHRHHNIIVLVAVIAGGSAGGEAPLSYPQMIVVDLDGRVTFSWLTKLFGKNTLQLRNL